MVIDSAKSVILRWPKGEPRHAELLKAGGVEFIVDDPPNPAFREALQKVGITPIASGALPPIAEEGLWPGISRGPNVKDRGDETASASRAPWVDANGFHYHVHRANAPQRPAVLGYLPDEKAGVSNGRVIPFETLELALAEARVNGGNYILGMDPRYREALIGGDAKAMAAWKTLGTTTQWLKANGAMFGRRPVPVITGMVDGTEETAEFANLLFRHGATPLIASVARPPRPSADILVVSAIGLKTVPEPILAHARAGATVIIDSKPNPSWKKIKPERDRDFYELGKGRVLVYHEPIVDPSEYALDVIDVATHKRRAARLWNAQSIIPLATEGATPGEVLLHLLNYGSRVDQEVQIRVQGGFSKAVVLRPDGPPTDLKLFGRGTMSEVFLPALNVVASIRFIR